MLETSNLCESFLDHLIDEGVIDPEGALLALDEQRRKTPAIGRIALLNGALTMKQVFEVLHVQADTGLRFGEQAIKLGYITERRLVELLREQQNSKPGVGGILFDLGLAKKGDLQKNRREFMRDLESVLA